MNAFLSVLTFAVGYAGSLVGIGLHAANGIAARVPVGLCIRFLGGPGLTQAIMLSQQIWLQAKAILCAAVDGGFSSRIPWSLKRVSMALAAGNPAVAWALRDGHWLQEYLRAYGRAIRSSVTAENLTASQVVMGFVSGVADMVNRPFCVADYLTTVQADAIVARVGNAHPEALDENAAALVVTALREAYPCLPARSSIGILVFRAPSGPQRPSCPA